MAKIIPFRGIVYNQKKAGNIEDCVCPPYDVISPEIQQKLYQKNTYNVVRLEFGLETVQDSETDNRYTRASRTFQDWLENGILQQSEAPALYIYDMEYHIDGHKKLLRGFIGRVKIEDFNSGIVLPHESTLSGPKADRFNLIQTCRAQFSQIYSLYSDPEGRIARILAKPDQQPVMTVRNDNGVTHRIRPLTKGDDINAIAREMADKAFFIADGHHRYETALEYRNMRRKQGITSGTEAFNYVTMYLARLEDPSLTILPAHRALYNLAKFNPDSFERELNGYFDLTRFDFDQRNEPELRETVIKKMTALAARNHSFVMRLKTQNRYYLLTLRSDADLERMIPGKSAAYQNLDVSILHHLIIEKMLGIKMELQKLGTNIEYVKDADDAIKRVEDGAAEIVFLMNPTKVGDVKAVAAAGERMPQKATYFYPKLLTGLVMDKLD